MGCAHEPAICAATIGEARKYGVRTHDHPSPDQLGRATIFTDRFRDASSSSSSRRRVSCQRPESMKSPVLSPEVEEGRSDYASGQTHPHQPSPWKSPRVMTAILPSLCVERRCGIDRGVTEKGNECSAKHTVHAIGRKARRHWVSKYMTITTINRRMTNWPRGKAGLALGMSRAVRHALTCAEVQSRPVPQVTAKFSRSLASGYVDREGGTERTASGRACGRIVRSLAISVVCQGDWVSRACRDMTHTFS